MRSRSSGPDRFYPPVPISERYTEGGLVVANLRQLISTKIPPRPRLVDPWLMAQDLVMVYAARGIGKTFWALGLGMAVASGTNFMDWHVSRPGRVLFVDGEMSQEAMQERCQQLWLGLDRMPADDAFRIITPDMQDQHMPDLSTKKGQQNVEEHLRGVSLLILDNLSSLVRSGIENDAESWLPVQSWLLSLRRQGIAVLIVHHAGKSNQQRGTSRREDVLDVVINLRRPRNYAATAGARFEIHFEKARGLSGSAVRPLEAQLAETESGGMVWNRTDQNEELAKTLELLSQGMSMRQVAVEVGKSSSWVHNKKKEFLT